LSNGRNFALIVQEVGEASFAELLATINQQIRSKDVLSVMVQQRTVAEAYASEMCADGGQLEDIAVESVSHATTRAFEALVADLFS